jgi:signal peptidase I
MTTAHRVSGSAVAPGSVAGTRGRGGPPWWSTLVLGLATVWLSLGGSMAFWVTAPSLLGWRPYVVLTDSMRPGLVPGDVVLISDDARAARKPLRPGEIALVADADLRAGSRLHRFIRHEDDGRVVTKGDANFSEDSASPAAAVLGRARLVVPRIGMPVIWLHDRAYLPLGLVGAGTWTAAVVAFRRRPTQEL